MAALWQLIADKFTRSAIHDRRWATNAPNSPGCVPVAIVPVHCETYSSPRTLSRVGKVGIERDSWVISGVELHSLGRIVKLNLVAAAHHHGILNGPVAVFVMSVFGVLIRFASKNGLADNQNQDRRNDNAHLKPPFFPGIPPPME